MPIRKTRRCTYCKEPAKGHIGRCGLKCPKRPFSSFHADDEDDDDDTEIITEMVTDTESEEDQDSRSYIHKKYRHNGEKVGEKSLSPGSDGRQSSLSENRQYQRQ